MLTLTEKARRQLGEAVAEGLFESARLRVFVDHRCHCGKAHFSLALDDGQHPGDAAFDIAQIPFIVDARAVQELSCVEIDFTETVWTKGFTIRNTAHDCGAHMVA